MPGVRLAAVVDRDADRAADIAARHGTRALGSIGDLPADLAAVTVAVPTSAHAVVVEECLGRGYAVLVEKPMAANLQDAERMVAAARRAGRLLCVGHTERFNPAFRAAAPRLREARFIEAHRLGVFTARSTDVDVVLDLMIHDLDIVLSSVRSPIAAIDAVGVHALTDKVDIANARLRFENGCVANLTASRISAERVRKIRVFTRDSYVAIDCAQQEAMAYTLRRGASHPEIVREAIAVTAGEPLDAELRAFAERVRGGDAPVVSADEGLLALRAALRIVDQIRLVGS